MSKKQSKQAAVVQTAVAPVQIPAPTFSETPQPLTPTAPVEAVKRDAKPEPRKEFSEWADLGKAAIAEALEESETAYGRLKNHVLGILGSGKNAADRLARFFEGCEDKLREIRRETGGKAIRDTQTGKDKKATYDSRAMACAKIVSEVKLVKTAFVDRPQHVATLLAAESWTRTILELRRYRTGVKAGTVKTGSTGEVVAPASKDEGPLNVAKITEMIQAIADTASVKEVGELMREAVKKYIACARNHEKDAAVHPSLATVTAEHLARLLFSKEGTDALSEERKRQEAELKQAAGNRGEVKAA